MSVATSSPVVPTEKTKQQENKTTKTPWLSRCESVPWGQKLPVPESHDFEEAEFLPAGKRKPPKDFKHRKQYRFAFQMNGALQRSTVEELGGKQKDKAN